MKPSLRPGLSKVKRIVIDRDRTIGFMGEEGRVYGTPELGRDMEQTCRELLLEHADTGEDSVGIEITIRHTAATLPGMTVEVVAKDDLEPIGGGPHTRFVVDVAKTYERLQAKAKKFAAARGK